MNNFQLSSDRLACILIKLALVVLKTAFVGWQIKLLGRVLGWCVGVKKNKAATLEKGLQPYLSLCFDLLS